ncbi:MAG: ADP-ribosyltransferase domain-containing protein [Pseudomonadota bacterium]
MKKQNIIVLFSSILILIIILNHNLRAQDACTDLQTYRSSFVVDSSEKYDKWNMGALSEMISEPGLIDKWRSWSYETWWGTDHTSGGNRYDDVISPACRIMLAKVATAEMDKYISLQEAFCQDGSTQKHRCEGEAELKKIKTQQAKLKAQTNKMAQVISSQFGSLPPMVQKSNTDSNGNAAKYYDFDCSNSRWCSKQQSGVNTAAETVTSSRQEINHNNNQVLEQMQRSSSSSRTCPNEAVIELSNEILNDIPYTPSKEKKHFRDLCKQDPIGPQIQSYGYKMSYDPDGDLAATGSSLLGAVSELGGIYGKAARIAGFDTHIDSINTGQKRSTLTSFKETLMKNQWAYMNTEERNAAQSTLEKSGLSGDESLSMTAPYVGDNKRGTANHMSYFKDLSKLDPSKPDDFIPYMSSSLFKKHIADKADNGEKWIPEAAKLCIILDKEENIDEMGKMAREMVLGTVISGILMSATAASRGSSYATTTAIGIGVDSSIFAKSYMTARSDYREALEKRHLVGDEHIEEMRQRLENAESEALWGMGFSIAINGITGGGGAMFTQNMGRSLIKNVSGEFTEKGAKAAEDYLRNELKRSLWGKELIGAMKKFLNEAGTGAIGKLKKSLVKYLKKKGIPTDQAEEVFNIIVKVLKDEAEEGLELASKASTAQTSSRASATMSRPAIQGAAHELTTKNIDDLASARMARSVYPVREVFENASLGQKERLARAAADLGMNKFSRKQSAALIAAHNIGSNESESVFRYTSKQLSEKLNILKNGGFTLKEAKMLMQKGYAGSLGTQNKIVDLGGGLKINTKKVDKHYSYTLKNPKIVGKREHKLIKAAILEKARQAFDSTVIADSSEMALRKGFLKQVDNSVDKMFSAGRLSFNSIDEFSKKRKILWNMYKDQHSKALKKRKSRVKIIDVKHFPASSNQTGSQAIKKIASSKDNLELVLKKRYDDAVRYADENWEEIFDDLELDLKGKPQTKQKANELGLSKHELTALMLYTGSNFEDINGALRKEIRTQAPSITMLLGKSKEELKALRTLVSSALRKMPSQEGQVFRGQNYRRELIETLKPGDLMKDPGYFSASTSYDVAQEWSQQYKLYKHPQPVVFKIDHKGGKNITDFSFNPTEDEVLFRDSTAFKVLSIDKSGNPWIIHIEEIINNKQRQLANWFKLFEEAA